MKIGICGATGTGKTTLALNLAKEKNIVGLTGLIRAFQEKHGSNWKELRNDPKRFLDWQYKILANQITKEKKLDSFVSDRTSLDYIPYVLMHCHCQNEDLVINFIESAINHAKKYTHIIYIPFHNNFKSDDEVREHSLVYNMQFDFLLQGILKEYNVSYIEIGYKDLISGNYNGLIK